MFLLKKEKSATLIKRYTPQFDKLNKEDLEISEVLMDIIRPEQCE